MKVKATQKSLVVLLARLGYFDLTWLLLPTFLFYLHLDYFNTCIFELK